jgi:MoxR-like ATPase
MNDHAPPDPPESSPPAAPPPGSRVTPARIGGRPTPPARSAESRTAPPSTPAARVDDFRETFTRLRTELGTVIVGQADVLEQILIALFAGGHVLIEGVPGTGKTLIVRTLGQALNLSFNRIQFTIDLMPADITGTRILTEQDGQREMVFARGPVFAHVLLADEINRATPKTQSALLEAMAERQVTVAGTTHKLAAPFFVLATLNPIEMEGTYPLPEAQLDRFLFKVFLPYPSTSEMQRIIGSTTGADLAEARPVFAPRRAASRVEELKTLVREVLVAPHLEEYASALVGRRSRAARSSRLPDPRRCRLTSSSAAMCRSDRARAAARRYCSAPKFAPCSPAVSTSPTRTSIASPFRR